MDTNWHHVAVAKSGSAVVFYVDGIAYPAAAFSDSFIFTTTAAIGMSGGAIYGFWGSIYEMAVYNRDLAASEIQVLYNAGGLGKCVIDSAPTIVSQPANQTVFAGEYATLEVLALGTWPLSYQWNLNGNSLPGATSSSLIFTNAELSQAGTYTVLVTNLLGSLLSSNAVLTVNPAPPCAPPPAGLVSWWRGGGNALDQVGANNGTAVGNTTYGAGRVGQAFVFGGANGDGVTLGNPASLHLQDLTIEAWIKRANASRISTGPDGAGVLLAYGYGGYSIAVLANGSLNFGKPYFSEVTSVAGLVSDTNWHHVVVAKSGSAVVFCVDGIAYPAAAFGDSFVFTSTAAIGMMGESIYGFWGSIDELAVYSRALAVSEIQAIYNARSSGKCVVDTPPTIVSQPTSQTVFAGDYATFEVLALGTRPLSYQWNLNGNSLSGATNSSLILTNAQLDQAGTYTVLVTNLMGSVQSSNAVLTVNPPPPCAPPPAGLVSWWRGGGNALDQAGTNNGTALGNSTYGAGRVGQAFVFGGANGDGVTLGNPAGLQLQNLTIEAWIKRSSASQISTGPEAAGALLAYGSGGYTFAVQANGSLSFGKAYFSEVKSVAGLISDTNWHYVAVDKSGSTVVFYADGIAYPAAAYSESFTFTTTAAIGMVGNAVYGFWGSIDELAVYSRPLAAAELQAIYAAGNGGKCTAAAPVVTAQPLDQTVTVGGTATFTVGVGGTAPLSYQWQFSGTNIAAATNISLTLSNVQFTQAGNYAVWVTNAYGSCLSSNALLTV
ncbi:MAG: immunoglobulin domain-containing protein, partial [Verrucomicrobia bacterium]|nr:immunoglobulin domain-containing protein [Verrucomicrobiota bacterium]